MKNLSSIFYSTRNAWKIHIFHILSFIAKYPACSHPSQANLLYPKIKIEIPNSVHVAFKNYIILKNEKSLAIDRRWTLYFTS